MTVDGSNDHLLALDGYQEIVGLLGPLNTLMATLRARVRGGLSIKEAVKTVNFGSTLPVERVEKIITRKATRLPEGGALFHGPPGGSG